MPKKKPAIHICQFDFVDAMRLVCKDNSDHQEVLMPDRRKKVLRELREMKMLCGSALGEATHEETNQRLFS